MSLAKQADNQASAYTEVGVDVDANDRLIPRYRELAESAGRPEQLGEVGAFSGLFDLSGTKTRTGSVDRRRRHQGHDRQSGRTSGRRWPGSGQPLHQRHPLRRRAPLFFLDYLAATPCRRMTRWPSCLASPPHVERATSHCSAVKPRTCPTSIHPDTLTWREPIIGVFEKVERLRAIVSNQEMSYWLVEYGLHTNGYSLARAVFGLRPG